MLPTVTPQRKSMDPKAPNDHSGHFRASKMAMPLVAQQDKHYLCFPVSLAKASKSTGDVPGRCSHHQYNSRRQWVETLTFLVPLLPALSTGMLCSHKIYFSNLKASCVSAPGNHNNVKDVFVGTCTGSFGAPSIPISWLPVNVLCGSVRCVQEHCKYLNLSERDFLRTLKRLIPQTLVTANGGFVPASSQPAFSREPACSSVMCQQIWDLLFLLEIPFPSSAGAASSVLLCSDLPCSIFLQVCISGAALPAFLSLAASSSGHSTTAQPHLDAQSPAWRSVATFMVEWLQHPALCIRPLWLCMYPWCFPKLGINGSKDRP